MPKPFAGSAIELLGEAAELRDQAERCRRLSKSVTDRDMAAILAKLAVQFEKQAIAKEQAAAASDTS